MALSTPFVGSSKDLGSVSGGLVLAYAIDKTGTLDTEGQPDKSDDNAKWAPPLCLQHRESQQEPTSVVYRSLHSAIRRQSEAAISRQRIGKSGTGVL
jgi:hypothetical protein